jgi:dienelactone hydrolase
MTEVVLFHHVQGVTDGVRALADRLRAGGHTVHVPDLYGGQVASTLEDGFAIKNGLGDEVIAERLERALADLPSGLVYAGISYGVMTAQRLAQSVPGARGALLYEAFVSTTAEWAFGAWPEGVPVQVHGMDADPIFVGEGDVEAARELVASTTLGELFLYPGDQHYFLDPTLPSYDPDAAALVMQRTLTLLRSVE